MKSYRLQSTDSKKGKSADSSGIRAEDIKACDEETKEMVRQIFNELVTQNEFTPGASRKVRKKVIYRNRRRGRCWKLQPDLFSACVVQAVYDNTAQQIFPRLDQIQAEDQAEFRSSYQTTDHPATYRMIDQRCHEWGITMSAATIDFMKAFESITHKSILDALKSCGIEIDYIHLLKISPPEKFSRDQKATVLTGEESDMFEIKKGTKQGDPLSSLLFNTVLQKALEEDIPRWQKKRGRGICLGDNDHDCLTNMRFADDVLLFASSKEQLPKNVM